MPVEANEQAARRSFEAWNGDESALDAIDEQCVNHDPALPEPAVGRQAIANVIRDYRNRLSNLRVEVHEVVSDGDLVATRWTSTGTDTDGRAIETEGLALNRVRDGRLVEGWSHWNARR